MTDAVSHPHARMAPMLFDFATVTAESVRDATDAAIAEADARVAGAVAAPPSFDATLLPLELAGADLMRAYGIGAFMGQVHPDADVRDAGTDADERLSKWRVAVAFRRDLFEAVRAFATTDEARALSGERARLAGALAARLPPRGAGAGAEQAHQLETLRNRLVEVEVAFQRNLNEFRDGIDVTREQLDGLGDAYIERLSPGEREGTPA